MAKSKKDIPLRPVGRPELEWNAEREALFEALMGIPFVTAEAVCEVMKISESTLTRRLKDHYGLNFDDLRTAKQGGIKLKLAGKQYEKAMKGDNTMLIWLGKQWLGQSEKHETTHKGRIDQHSTIESPQEQLERIKNMVKDGQ